MVAVTYSQINDAYQSLRNYNVVEITLPSHSAMSEEKIGYCISISNWRELDIFNVLIWIAKYKSSGKENQVCLRN